MTKAIRMMTDEIKNIDGVIYVLDARAPLSCINPAFDSVIGSRPRLYVINKFDLIEKTAVQRWTEYFNKLKMPTVFADSAHKTDVIHVKNGLKLITSKITEKYKARGIDKTIRAMVLGIPNSGKSTLINSLSSEKKAVTGNRPGVTRGKQWITIDNHLDLLDSPGVLYPDFSDQKKATNLALLGSIKDDILDVTELAIAGITLLKKIAPSRLVERYNLIALNDDPFVVLEEITKQRGYLLKGNVLDTERGATAFINDLRKGLIGKFVLDTIPRT
jgi:ribosome biogenesis GTPase A